MKRNSVGEAERDKGEVACCAKRLLQQAGVAGCIPTPVHEVIACAGLVESGEISLEEKEIGRLARVSGLTSGVLLSAISKIRGMLDVRTRIIYIDKSLGPARQVFVRFHEIGHRVLPWQRDIYLFTDDERSLSPDIRHRFEWEANLFAADMLFQVEALQNEAQDYPLSMKSVIALAQRFGASYHATVRRYVETHTRPCALLVADRVPQTDGDYLLNVQYTVESTTFHHRFGSQNWPPILGSPFSEPPEADDLFRTVDSVTLRDKDRNAVECFAHVFDNSYNTFVLVFPVSAKRRSRLQLAVQ